jgi:5-methylthioadenosine/S-adenosylhomocysteine deaminase
MFEAMRQAAFLHKLASRDPRWCRPGRRSRWPRSAAPARSASRSRIGSLEAGKLADVIVVRTDRPRQVPMYDPVSHLVYATRGDDVVLTSS